MRPILAGSTDVSIRVRALAASGPYAAAYNDAGIALWYKRGATGAKTTITPATQTSTGAHTDGGFVHIGEGECRLDLPDAAVAAGVDRVVIGAGATAWAGFVEEILLTSGDPTAALATAAALNTVDDFLDTEVAAIKAKTDNLPADPADQSAVEAAITTAQTALASAIATRLADSDYVVPPSVGAIADQVWDELLAGHAVAGSAGAALSTAGAAADPMLNTPGDYTSGQLGYLIGRLAGGRITVQSTVTPTGEIAEIVAGADYLAEDGRALEWTDAEEAWPDLTGATVTWCARAPGGVAVEHAGSVVTPTGEKVVRVELTHAQTAALAAIRAGGWAWSTWAELPNGNLIPLVRGGAPVMVVVGPPE